MRNQIGYRYFKYLDGAAFEMRNNKLYRRLTPSEWSRIYTGEVNEHIKSMHLTQSIFIESMIQAFIAENQCSVSDIEIVERCEPKSISWRVQKRKQ